MGKYKNIGKSVRKVDGLSLATGQEKFFDDFPLDNPLYLALLYSPHAHAEILDIDDSEARKMCGVVDVYHYKNVPRVMHTTAGQGFPEPSPYDNVIFDKKMRFVGDRVAMVAAESEQIAKDAIKAIDVEYNILPAVYDIEKATDNNVPQLQGDDAYVPIPVIFKPEENIAAQVEIAFGDLKKGMEEADFVEEHTYRTQIASHCAIENHGAVAYIDDRGRLVIVTPTQVPFHARRIVSKALSIPVGMIRVIKPRIGGGFGGKQEVFLEQLVGLVTWQHKRPSRIALSREEVFVSSRTRHAMRVKIAMGAKSDGELTAIDMDARMNSGAYGTHALTVLSNAGSKVLPLFNKVKHVHFLGKTVYTNLPVGGAYRGYGATQGYFAFCQEIDNIARKCGQDILEYYKKWHIKEGETSGIFEALGEGKEGVSQYIRSCKLTECIDKGAKAIDWYAKRNKRIRVGESKVKGVGVACCMQGSGIPRVDMGSASMKMNEDGSFNMYVGATDLGTGSDTILAQIAAEILQIPVEKIIVLSSDTDLTPFDVGAYASSTTYVSGGAVRKCAIKIADQIKDVASEMMSADKEDLILDSLYVINIKNKKKLSFEEICCYSLYTNNQFQIQAEASHYGKESPPPFIAQFAEVDIDKRTGHLDLISFVSAVDCGQPINPKLAEGQVEGAVVNGLAYALWEEYLFNSAGKMTNPSFWDYKIFTTADLPRMVTIVEDSYEETGPFGAKSVGEIAIDGPLPAIANAIYDAVGVRMYEAPFTSERIYNRMKEEGVI